MKTHMNDALDLLVRYYAKEVGSSGTTVAALNAYIQAVGRIRCPDKMFMDCIRELNCAIGRTQPRIVPLMRILYEFADEMKPYSCRPLETARLHAAAVLEAKRDRFKSDTISLSRHCSGCIAPDDVIIAHCPPGYIRDAFVIAHRELKRPFSVLILKNDVLRTRELVTALQQWDIPHTVTDEFNLIHFIKQADKLFISAASVTTDSHAVACAGAAAVASLCRWYRVPVYLFAETIKFSSTVLSEQHIRMEEQERTEAGYTFHMTGFSHGAIELAMVDHLFTEKGEISPP